MVQVAEIAFQVLMAVVFAITPGIMFWLAVTGIVVAFNRVKDTITRPVGKREEKLALT